MSIDERIKNMWYINTIDYYSDLKKNARVPFVATWVDLEMIIPSMSEIQVSYDITYMQILKNDRNEPIYKTETEFMINSGEGVGTDTFGVWD